LPEIQLMMRKLYKQTTSSVLLTQLAY